MKSLIIGKFYPPHNGHKFLIDTAISESDSKSDTVYIIICHKQNEIPSGNLRMKWISEWYKNYKNINIKLIDNVYNDDNNSQLLANLTKQWLGFIPDVVFTSETYGDNYAKYLDCKHRMVDINRNTIPISGTQIRNDPIKFLDYLQQNVRTFYVPRIVLVGAESTGKTTLAEKLGKEFGVTVIPEYGRIVAENKTEEMESWKWTTEEFINIANSQIKAEIEATTNNKFIICDTDAFASSIWHVRYVGSISEEIEKIQKEYAQTVHKQIYLLTTNDVPFVQDGYRDGENIRDWMFETFVKKIKDENKQFYVLDGNSYDERYKMAHKIIKNIL